MCSPTSLTIQLDFSDSGFAKFTPDDISKLYLSLIITNLTEDKSKSQSSKHSFPLITFLAPLTTNSSSESNNGKGSSLGTYQLGIDLNSLTGFCPPGSNWYWTGVSGIALGSSTGGNTITNNKTNYTSVSVAYDSYSSSNKAFTLTFGDPKLNSDMTIDGYSATCTDQTATLSLKGLCHYVMKIGDEMELNLRPTVINVPNKTTIIPKPNTNNNIPPLVPETRTTRKNKSNNTTSNNVNYIIFDVHKSSITGAMIGGLSSTEKIAIAVIVMIIIGIIIGAIIYVMTRPSKGSITDISLDTGSKKKAVTFSNVSDDDEY